MKAPVVAGLMLALVVASCATRASADAVERDRAYGPQPAQRLDIYRAASVRSNAPLVLFIHGGGWRIGDKAMPRMVDNKVAHWLPRGYVLVSANYRMLPGAPVEEQLEDVARALAYTQAHAAEWGADPGRIVLMGHSAGAHLVALLTADVAVARREGVKPWRATVALDSAAMDVAEVMRAPHLPLYDRAFGKDAARWDALSPLQQMTQAPPPLLMVCSTRRELPCPQARRLAERAVALGARATVLPVDLSHMQVNERLGLRGAYTDAVDGFLGSIGLP